MKRFIRRLLAIVRWQRVEDELAREVEAHLGALEDEYARRGMTRDEARLAARRAMGSVALAKDLHRDARSFGWIEDLRRDSRHARRALFRNPGYTASVVLTLALGIGATTAIFSVVNAVLVRPLPYPDADRLVYLFEEFPPADGSGTPDRRPAMDVQMLETFRTHTRTLSRVGVQQRGTATMASGEQTVRVSGSRISPAFLSMLGAQPLLGRLFDAHDEAVGGVVLLSHAAWRRYFGGDTSVVGQPLVLDGRTFTVRGVLSPDFQFYPNPQADYWIPFVVPTSEFLMVPVLAQVRQGVSIDAAVAEVTTVLQQLRGSTDPARFVAVRVQDQMVAAVKPALLVLTCAVGFVLIIACVNVANLVLARTTTREREIAVRGALGASASRMATLFLAESLLLALAGGVAATGLAFGAIELLRVLGTSVPRPDGAAGISIPRLDEVGLDVATLLFAFAVTLSTGVLFGLVPVMRRHRFALGDALRGAATHAAGNVLGGARIRRLLVVGEVALAMVLLIGGALMMTSFVKLVTVDRGYDPGGVVTFQLTLPEGREMATVAEDLVGRLQGVDGVRAAGYSTDGPMTQSRGHFPLRTTPRRDNAAPGEPTADPVYVSRDYFKAMGIDVVAGRGFEGALGSQQVMLVNQTLASSGMVGPNPIGARAYALFRQPWEIVGIVRDTRLDALDQEPHAQFFVDLRQVPGFPFSEFRPYFAVRTAGDVTPLLSNLRDIVRQLEPRATVQDVATVDQIVWNSISRPRLYTVCIAVFAGVALVLAAIGIFGLMAYLVEQRTREIGIRMALGAQRSAVLSGTLGQSVLLVVIGVAGGLIAAAGLTRYLEGMLFGLTPLHPATFAGASMLFVVTALGAAYVPASRATRVDPVVALRAE